MWNPFKSFLHKSFLGVDIGTSYLRMVEIYSFGGQKKLGNYGHISASLFYEKPIGVFKKNSLLLSDENIAKSMKSIKKEAGIKSNKVIFSIPDFSTFFTNFSLPPMNEDELPQAVKYEAKQHIPLLLSEVTLDWQIIGKEPVDKKNSKFKILLVAVPNVIVSQYQKIARSSGLELVFLEAEVFSLLRSLVRKKEKETVILVDIGAQSTTCSIVDEGMLKMSYSFDMSSNDFTSALIKSLAVNFDEAQALKEKYGIIKQDGETERNGRVVRENIIHLVDFILGEIRGIMNIFSREEGKKIKKIIMAGSTALMPGLKEYFENYFDEIEVQIGNPFIDIDYPLVLKETLTEMGPSFAIAVGAALRGFE